MDLKYNNIVREELVIYLGDIVHQRALIRHLAVLEVDIQGALYALRKGLSYGLANTFIHKILHVVALHNIDIELVYSFSLSKMHDWHYFLNTFACLST